MSPEQARGKEVDQRSDIYSLSLVVFEMLTGRQAYTASSITDLLRAQVTEPVPHVWEVDGVRDIPDGLDAVLQRGASKNRDERFISMGQFADALSKALPTMSGVGPYGDPSKPQLDPSGPGRTFLGPGAPGGSLDQVPNQSIAPPVSTGQAVPSFDATEGTYVPGSLAGLQVQEPAPNGSGTGPQMTPVPSPISNQQTMLKAGAAGPAATLPQKSPSLVMMDERPVPHPAPAPSKLPWIFGGVGLLAAVLALVVVPKLNAAPAPSPAPVVAASPPVAIAPAPPAPPPVVAAPTPPTPTQVAVAAPPPAPPVAPPAAPPGPAPTPGNTPPSRHPRPGPHDEVGAVPKEDAAAKITEAAWQEKVSRARDDFSEGNLESAMRIVATVDPSSPFAEAAGRLRSDITKVQELNGRAKRLADTGDCTGATALWTQALQTAPGYQRPKKGIDRCKSAALPTTLDP